jgi:uncharacterized protein YcfJ
MPYLKLSTVRVGVVAAALWLSGCSSVDDTRLVGQVVGTAVGLAVGAQFGNGLGTIMVATHTAWVGFQVGEILSQLDLAEPSQ